MIEMRGGVSLVFRICTVPLPNNAALQAEWARVEIRKRQFWSTSVQLVFDAANGRRVRIFAGARDGYEGFEFLASQHQAQKGSTFCA